MAGAWSSVCCEEPLVPRKENTTPEISSFIAYSIHHFYRIIIVSQPFFGLVEVMQRRKTHLHSRTDVTVQYKPWLFSAPLIGRNSPPPCVFMHLFVRLSCSYSSTLRALVFNRFLYQPCRQKVQKSSTRAFERHVKRRSLLCQAK